MFNFPPQVYIISRNIYVIYHLYICFRRKERTYLSGQPWARAIDVLRQLVVLTDQITHRYLVQDLVRLPVRPVLSAVPLYSDHQIPYGRDQLSLRNKLSTVSENILLSTIDPLNADIFSDTIRVTMITKTVTMSEQIRDGHKDTNVDIVYIVRQYLQWQF